MQRVLSITLLLLACVVASAMAQKFTRVKYINAYPREGSLAVFITTNDYVAKNLVGIPYGEDTEWFYLPYGEYIFRLGYTGAVNYTQVVMLSTPSQYVIASQDQNGKFYFVTVLDDSSFYPPTAAGQANVAAVHVLNGDTLVDIGIGAETTRLANYLLFFSVSLPVALPNGTYTVDLRPVQQTGTPLASLEVSLQPGRFYLILVFGNKAESGTYAPRLGLYELADWSINARVAFVHGLPAADLPVNVIANEILPLFRNVNYKNVTDYQNIPVGMHNITVENEGSAAIMITAFFNGFTESTLYATAGPDGPNGILLLDENTAPEPGKTRIRVLHGTNSPPAVDVLAAPEFVFPKLAYGLTGGYMPTNVSSLSITVNVASSDTTVYSLNLPLTANSVVTLLATGDPEGSGTEAFTFIVVTDATYGANGNLRAFRSVPGGLSANVKVDGSEVISDLAFKNASSYVSTAPGLYRVSVHVAGSDVEILRSSIRIDAEGYFTVVAGGTEDNPLFQLRDDNTRPAASTTHLRVVHASAPSPEIDIQLSGETLRSLVYAEAFGYISLPSNSYGVRLVTTEGKTQVFSGSFDLEADTVISAWAVGEVGNNASPFEVVVTIDFDYRTPVAPTTSPASSPSDNPASPSANPSSPSATPTRTPSRLSSATAFVASSSVLIALALLC